MPGPDGTVMHAEVSIGNSRLMLGEVMPPNEPSSSYFYLYVNDADAMYKRALGAGASSVSQPTDQFWGDRSGTFTDPEGYAWTIATRKEDLSPEEMEQRRDAWMKQFAPQPTHS